MRVHAFLLTAAALIAGEAVAQTAPAPAPARAAPSPEQAAQMERELAAYSAMPDTAGTGRYPALKEADPTLSGHVVYRPANLAALGRAKLGVLVWGNGGCREDGASARLHLSEIASHGYLAIAPGTILSGPGAPPPKPRDAALGVKTTTAEVLAGIDWALAENARRGSRYYGRIDPRMIAVAGHSCGGLQAIQAAADPRIRAVIVHNSGIFADGSNPITGMTVDKSLLGKLHTPVLYVLGGRGDVAWPNGTDDFAKIAHVPAMLLDLDVGHGGTFRQPNGGRVAQVAVKWLDWQLRGDAAAAKTFVGADCTLCRDPAWRVERKRL